MVAPCPAEEEVDVLAEIDGVAVHLHNPVPGQQVVPSRGKPVMKRSMVVVVRVSVTAMGDAEPTSRKKKDEHAGERMNRFQAGLLLKARGSGVLLLPLHGAEAADGEQPQVYSVSLLPVQDAGPHADGELVDLTPAAWRRRSGRIPCTAMRMPNMRYGDQDIDNHHAITSKKKE